MSASGRRRPCPSPCDWVGVGVSEEEVGEKCVYIICVKCVLCVAAVAPRPCSWSEEGCVYEYMCAVR